MTQHTDDQTGTLAFHTADRRITALLDKMRRQGVCGCCAGRAMLLNAVRAQRSDLGQRQGSRDVRRDRRHYAREQLPRRAPAITALTAPLPIAMTAARVRPAGRGA